MGLRAQFILRLRRLPCPGPSLKISSILRTSRYLRSLDLPRMVSGLGWLMGRHAGSLTKSVKRHFAELSPGMTGNRWVMIGKGRQVPRLIFKYRLSRLEVGSNFSEYSLCFFNRDVWHEYLLRRGTVLICILTENRISCSQVVSVRRDVSQRSEDGLALRQSADSAR